MKRWRAIAQKGYDWIVPLTATLALFFLLVFRLPLVVLAGCLALAALGWAARASPFPRTPVNVPVLLLWTGLAIGLVLTPAPEAGIWTAAIVIAGSLLMFGLYEKTRGEEQLWTWTAGLVAASTGAALAVPFVVLPPAEKLFTYPEMFLGLPRVATVNPNQFAGALELAVLPALALVIGSRRWRALGVLGLPPVLLGLALLQSRGALVGLGVGVVVFGALYNRWFLPGLLLLAVGLAAVNYGLGGPVPVDVVLARSETSAQGNLEERVALWQVTSRWLVDAPWGLGAGGYPLYHDALLSDAFDETLRPHTHELFLQVGLDTGLVGLAGFVSLVTVAVAGLWRAYRRRRTRHLYIAFLATWAVMLAHGAVDTVYWGNRASLFWWAALGISLAAARYAEGRKKRQEPDASRD
jgi:putative inorganic carbon (HCO3(-)) transporter